MLLAQYSYIHTNELSKADVGFDWTVFKLLHRIVLDFRTNVTQTPRRHVRW